MLDNQYAHEWMVRERERRMEAKRQGLRLLAQARVVRLGLTSRILGQLGKKLICMGSMLVRRYRPIRSDPSAILSVKGRLSEQ